MIRVLAEAVKSLNSAVEENSEKINGRLIKAPIKICKNKYGKCGDA